MAGGLSDSLDGVVTSEITRYVSVPNVNDGKDVSTLDRPQPFHVLISFARSLTQIRVFWSASSI